MTKTNHTIDWLTDIAKCLAIYAGGTILYLIYHIVKTRI